MYKKVQTNFDKFLRHFGINSMWKNLVLDISRTIYLKSVKRLERYSAGRLMEEKTI